MTSNKEKGFLLAIENGDVETVKKMLTDDPSLAGQADEHGFTPLMRAVMSVDRTVELVQALIDAGADVNAASIEGYTALHLMIDVNGPTGYGPMPGQIARLLAAAGADIHARQHWGWTPLMRAVVEGTTDELQAMVDIGGNVNEVFPGHALPAFMRGRTAVMAAIGSPIKVQILIDAGADVRARDEHDQTALEYARTVLADAESRTRDSPQCCKDIDESSLASAVDGLRKAGIDPDAPMPFDGNGMTYRQTIEKSMKEMISKAARYDFSGEVRKSITIIEKTLAAQP